MTKNKERLNELCAKFEDINIRKQLMKEFGESKTMFEGNDAEGCYCQLSIFSNQIVVRTFQKNGWVRVNYYDELGNQEGEMYEGRWK